MPTPKFDPTGKFTVSYTGLGRGMEADGRVYNNVGRAVENAFNTFAREANTYVSEKSKETPAQRLFKNKKEREIEKRIAEDAAIFRYKPEEFLDKVAQTKEKWLEEIPDDQYEWANLAFEERVNNFHRTILNNKIQLEHQQQLEDFTAQSDEYRTKALAAASAGDMLTFSQNAVKWRENEDFMFKNGFLNGDRKALRQKDFTENAIIQQNIAGAKLVFASPDKLNGFLTNIDKSESYSPELKHSIKQNILSEYNNWSAFNKVKNNEIIDRADFGIKAYGMGVEPAGFDINQTLQSLRASGLNDKADQLMNAYNLRQDMSSFATLAPYQMDEELNGLRKSAKSESDLDRIKALSNLAATAKKEIDADPIAYAAAHGLIEDDGLNLTKPETFATRQKNAAFIKEKYALPEITLTTKGEREAFKAVLNDADSAAKIVILSTMKQSLGDNYGRFLHEIEPKAPEFAHAGAVFERSPKAASMVLDGLDVMKSQPEIAPNAKDFDNKYSTAFKGMFAYKSPEWEKGLKNSIKAYIAADNRQKGRNSSSAFSDSFDEAVETLVGQKVRINGVPTVAPADVEPADFRKWFKGLDDKAFDKAVYENGNTVTAALAKSSGNLHYMADGIYLLSVDGEIVFDEEDKPFTLKYGEAK